MDVVYFSSVKGLGRSKSMEYAIKSQNMNIYLNQNTRSSLIEITKAFLSIENKTAYEVLGGPDDLKIKSSMTLFDTIQNENDLFDSVFKNILKEID